MSAALLISGIGTRGFILSGTGPYMRVQDSSPYRLTLGRGMILYVHG
nr:MAG TPA: hypothetical protein [Caudoviricetes sp.]